MKFSELVNIDELRGLCESYTANTSAAGVSAGSGECRCRKKTAAGKQCKTVAGERHRHAGGR